MPITCPTIEIELDKPRHLTLDFNALASFEEATGINALEKQGWGNLSAREFRAFLWACLLREDPSLTLEQVGAMIHLGNATEVGKKLGELWAMVMPKAEGGVETDSHPLPPDAGEPTG